MIAMIVFETIEGQTAKVARFVETLLGKSGHEARLVDAANKRANVSFGGVQKVVLAAPVHERRHPKAFEVFISASREALQERDVLMLSISLKAALSGGKEEAESYLEEMEMRTGFSAPYKLLVAGAVRQNSYDYFSSQILRHVVLAGQDGQFSHGDHEFTDWKALEADVTAFMEN